MTDLDTAAEGLARLALVGQVAEEHVDKIVPHVADRYRTSLDALYRDIVPLLREQDFPVVHFYYPKPEEVIAFLVGPERSHHATATTPAEALCLAAWDALRDTPTTPPEAQQPEKAQGVG